jgi:integrase
VAVETARTEARRLAGIVAANGDPQGDRREAARRERAIVSAAVDQYEAWITGRNLAKVATMMHALRRVLAGVMHRDIATLTQPELVEAIERVSRLHGTGAGEDARKHASAFFSRAVSLGLIPASPLAGYRKPRASRDDRADKEDAGRALTDSEVRAIWEATSPGSAALPASFAALVRTAICTGLRRGELAAMRWDWIDLNENTITVPAKVMKSGKAHTVIITPTLAAILDGQRDIATGPLVFPSSRRLDGGATPISGWSDLVARLRTASGVEGVGMHDFRRSYRSKLADLDVPHDIAEAMIAHTAPALLRAYQRSALIKQRRDAALAHDGWLRSVVGVEDGVDGSTVIKLPRRA